MSKTRTCYEESESRRQSMGWINTDLLQQQLGPKIKDTSLELMKMYIFICAHVQRKKQAYILQLENWNKTNALIHIPNEETHHERDDLNRFNSKEFTCLPLFALLVTRKEKMSVTHAGQFGKDRIHASRCSGRKFLSHLPLRSNWCERQSSI